ncbi:lipase maturation factor family protein, partial [Streptomyces sp. SID13726]|uniref:lipase maturation factor family protein n=1 Tax=Streptomyces sp. SID13726 TaxID=2706058 RepID=UPI0031B9F0C1
LRQGYAPHPQPAGDPESVHPHETDPQAWLLSLGEAAGGGLLEGVQAIGVSAQQHGLLPLAAFVDRTSWRDGPSVLRWRCGDRFVTGKAWCGVVLAGLLVVGLPQRGPWWVTTLAFLLLWAAYLSVVNAGQRFYGFGWESLLCEVTFLVGWLGSSGGGVAPPVLVLLAARWCLFRVELGAGLIKIRGD